MVAELRANAALTGASPLVSPPVPPGAPTFAEPPPLQHDMVTGVLLQHRAHRKAGLATSDDDGLMVLSHA